MREEYPALADYGSLWADLDAWTATLHTMASELARGITVEVECPDCEGRGYVDTSAGLTLFINGREVRQRDGLFDGFEVEVVASHIDENGTTDRRWCTCYDDPAPVLGRRTHALAGLIRAHVKREPWAAAELYVLAERLQAQGSRWGLWLAHWMVPARPRRRRRPRRWSGRLPRSRRSIAVERWLRPSHPARKELELELALVARWAAEQRRARRWSGFYASIARLTTPTQAAARAIRDLGIMIPGYPIQATPRDRQLEAEARALDLAVGVPPAVLADAILHDAYRRPEQIFVPSALDSLVGAPVTAALMAGVEPSAPAPKLPGYQREWLEGGRRVVGRVDSVSLEGDTRTGLRATARLRIDADEVERFSQAEQISAGYAAVEPAPEPTRSRQGPPIGDRLARRLRRGRPR